MKSKGWTIIFAIVFLILLVPLIAMQFTDEVNWSIMDFVVAGLLLSGLGLAIYFTFQRLKNRKYKWLIIGVVIFLFVLIWAELAVGIFGTSFAGN